MRVLASDNQLREVSVDNGPLTRRHKDGTFHVSEAKGRSLVRGGDFAQVGVNLSGATGWRCYDCGHLGVFRDKCGRCGSANLVQED